MQPQLRDGTEDGVPGHGGAGDTADAHTGCQVRTNLASGTDPGTDLKRHEICLNFFHSKLPLINQNGSFEESFFAES